MNDSQLAIQMKPNQTLVEALFLVVISFNEKVVQWIASLINGGNPLGVIDSRIQG